MRADSAAVTDTPQSDTVEIRARLDVPFTIINLATTIAPLILAFWFTTPRSVAAFCCAYTLCGLGLTVGYHRLFSHRAFRVSKALERAIAICGYLAIQRGPLFWVAMHRLHHKFVDIPGKDPHTPREGIWHVHFGWTHERRSDIWNPEIYRRWVPDLEGDPLYRLMDREATDYVTFILWNLATLGLGYSLGGVQEALAFWVWVGMLNRVALLHAFGFINSICHLFGSRPFATKPTDRSTNNLWVALLIFGEGWHNNHHAFPGSARQGLRWYQIDPSWWVIVLLERLGLARDVRRVPAAQEARKRREGEQGVRL